MPPLGSGAYRSNQPTNAVPTATAYTHTEIRTVAPSCTRRRKSTSWWPMSCPRTPGTSSVLNPSEHVKAVVLPTGSQRGLCRYETYREAWHLLKDDGNGFISV